MKVIAVIPARGGSKGIPRKNLCTIWDEPMIAHSIRIAKMCPLIDEVWVSTDDQEIKWVSESYKAKVIDRPKEISGDFSTDYEVFDHFVKNYHNYNVDNMPLDDDDILVHLRPTCPKRDMDFLIDCIAKFKSARYTSLRTVTPMEKSPYKMYRIEENVLVPLFDHVVLLEETPNYNFKVIREPFNQCRQILPQTYLHNGCIDIVRVSTIRRGSMTGNKILPIVMGESVDVDHVDDLKKLES